MSIGSKYMYVMSYIQSGYICTDIRHVYNQHSLMLVYCTIYMFVIYGNMPKININ
jgi:hypothetical protein